MWLGEQPIVAHSAGDDDEDLNELRSAFAAAHDGLSNTRPKGVGLNRSAQPTRRPRQVATPVLRDQFSHPRPMGPSSRDADDAVYMRRVMTAASAAAAAALRTPMVPRPDTFVVPTLNVSAAGRAPNLESVRQAELLIVAATGPAARRPPDMPDGELRLSAQRASISASKGAARQAEVLQALRLKAATLARTTFDAL